MSELSADYVVAPAWLGWRRVHSRPALRYQLCDVCDQAVDTFEMFQWVCPTAADGLLFGHRSCAQSDGEVSR